MEGMTNLEAKGTQRRKMKSKKRDISHLDCSIGVKHVHTAGEKQELETVPDMDGPTMEEKLASLEIRSDDNLKNTIEVEALSSNNIPSADSVHVLLKQALHAQDHSLLLNCLSMSDEKVITKSTALLNPSDVLKLLKSLSSMIELRGAVLIRALPWLKGLLCQHASSIASQESSLVILNSLYQLIDSRTSTYKNALQLSTILEFVAIPEADESSGPVIIYEDKGSDDDDESDDMMDSDNDDDELGAVIDFRDSDGSNVMSD